MTVIRKVLFPNLASFVFNDITQFDFNFENYNLSSLLKQGGRAKWNHSLFSHVA